ncbi:uncharacterized protein C8R40DRAFT_1068716 [Lentinula edodes]|uniref:uncharacterized protein n=1 Tax=Lentinula edodes TaxID=5353 RepID=UPI001E8D2919|nr:uncharacterized protein C8R40DRAFT_1068716 [Lentinula edodes]KAH7876397.1 hypothetical protein C8R40DRAFT_1068716 [Lentinula edodes]
MASPSRPEPMNATKHHPKVNVSLILAESYFVAGDYISGKMEMDCKADKGLGIGMIMIELSATQELTSRDHSARSTFIHARRLFQGPGLPPSNAVQAHPLPGDPPLPLHYHQAKRGHSTFLFRLPLPATSPSSISFGSGLASVKYEIRASVGVYWKGERQLVTERKDADVVEAYDEERIGQDEPEITVVGENGKIWCQARLIGGILIAGESACIELQVKNHSAKKNTGLSISLNRSLHLPNLPADEKPLHIGDTVTTVPFRGPEYIIPPGVEGVASLVFDVPKSARGVRGGLLVGDESEALKNGKSPRTTQGLFEVNCVIAVKMLMGLGKLVFSFSCKDILIEIPAVVVHPSALPELPLPEEQDPGYTYYDQQQVYQPYTIQSPSTPFPSQSPYPEQAQVQGAYVLYPALPMSPGPPGPALATGSYVDPNQNLVWLPPSIPFTPTVTPQPYVYPQSPNHLHAEYAMSLEMPASYPRDDDIFLRSPPQPSNPGLLSSSTTTVAALLSPPLPELPGLPPPSTHQDLTSMFNYSTEPILMHSQMRAPLSPTNVVPSSSSRVVPGMYGSATGFGDATPQTGIDGEQGMTHHTSARTLRVTSQTQRRGRSTSPIGGQSHSLNGGNDEPTSAGVSHPILAPLPPLNLNFRPTTLRTPLHSPRPVLSPKRSFTKVTEVSNAGEMVSKSVPKSERVEELERMADEVETRVRDLSSDLPPSSDQKQLDGWAEEPPPVPTITDKARLLLTKPRENDYFSIAPAPNQSALNAHGSPKKDLTNGDLAAPSSSASSRPRSRSRTPPTPATPTLTAVVTPRKSLATGYINGYSTKAVKAVKGKIGNDQSLLGLGFGVEGRAESGLDALERKLLAEVGTRKIVDEKRPDVWSVLRSGKEKNLSPNDTSNPGPGFGRDSGVGAEKTEKPSPIEIPRRNSDRDPFNDSAISSLTLPDCGDIEPAVSNSNAQPDVANAWKSTAAMDKVHGNSNLELDRDRDSDEKTHKGGLRSKNNKRKKHSSRGTLKDGQDGKEDDEGETREAKKKDSEKKGGKKKGKDRSSASKGRVAAWLGGVGAEPPLDDVISASPSPQPSRIVELPSDIEVLDKPHADLQSESRDTDSSKEKEKEHRKDSDTAILPPSPDPRSSGFVPIGTLKRDIYQRTLVPKDSPMASTSPSEDAKRITDIWNHRDTARHAGPSPKSNSSLNDLAKNPWQSVVGKGRLSVLPPERSDPEVKYDIRSARGGKGGRVTAVAAIWASGSVGASGKKPTATSPLSTPHPPGKSSKAIGKVTSPFSVPKFPVSVSSSSSSASGDGISGQRTTPTRRNVGVGVGVKVASTPVPAVISSSYAKPALSTTASLSRPTTAASRASPVKVPPTISEFPSEVRLESKSSDPTSNVKMTRTGLGLGAGKAANNLRAVTNSESKKTYTHGEHLAFGQARLRDLIKKYQG